MMVARSQVVTEQEENVVTSNGLEGVVQCAVVLKQTHAKCLAEIKDLRTDLRSGTPKHQCGITGLMKAVVYRANLIKGFAM